MIRNIILGTVIFILLVIAGASLYTYYRGNQLIRDYITTTIAKSSKGIYSVEMEDLSLNVITRRISIDGFRLIPDTLLYNKLAETDTLSRILFDIKMKEFLVRGFSLRHILLDKELHIRKIEFDSPNVTVLIMQPPKKREQAPSDPNMLSIPLPRGLEALAIQRIILNEGKLTVYNKVKIPEEKFEIPSLNIHIKNIIVDSVHRGQRIFNADDIQLSVKGMTIKTRDGMYTIIPGEIGLSTLSSTVWVNDLQVKPNYSNHEFSRKLGYQMDCMDIAIKKIEVKALDFRQLIINNKLIAGLITVDNLKMDDYRDKRVPMRPDFKPPLPQQSLLGSKMYIKIDSVKLTNSKVKYSEQVGNEPGYIFFDRLSGDLSNISNDSNQVKTGIVMKVNASMYLMGKGLLNARLNIPLGAENDAFTFSGTLKDMDMREINTMVTKMIPAEVTSGTIRKLEFNDVKANNDKATGRLAFYYNNFSLKVDKTDEKTWTKIKTGVLSWAGNVYVHNDNPHKNGTFTEGMIYFERDKHKSIFNFLWKSLFSGIKSTIGVNKEEQKQMKKEAKQKKKK